jgi:hypothetical protein
MLSDMVPPKRIPSCRVRTILESLDTDDRKILESALLSDEWSGSALSSALKERGLVVSAEIIRQHRRGGCSC